MTIFISYAREDQAIAEKLYYDLKRFGHAPWLDRFNILPGQNWQFEIKNALQCADYCIVLLSKSSVSKRGFVQKEHVMALDILDRFPETDIFLIPIRLDDCDIPMRLNKLNTMDLFPNYEHALNQLLSALSTPRQSNPPQSSTSNPFFYGGAVPTELFIGREDILQSIHNCIAGRTLQSFSIVGERRMGKSSVLAYIKDGLVSHFPNQNDYIVIYLDFMLNRCHTRAGFMRTLRKKIAESWHPPWDKKDDGQMDVFDDCLEYLQKNNKRLILLLDELETITQHPNEFDPLLEDFRANGQQGLLAMITATRIPLADLCAVHGISSPFFNIFRQRYLPLFSNEEWTRLIKTRMTVDSDAINWIEQMAGGHPFYTQMAASYLWDSLQIDHTCHIDVHQITHRLFDELEPHFNYLWHKCTKDEQSGLRFFAGISEKKPLPKIHNRLRQKGLIQDNALFSIAFQQFIQEVCYD